MLMMYRAEAKRTVELQRSLRKPDGECTSLGQTAEDTVEKLKVKLAAPSLRPSKHRKRSISQLLVIKRPVWHALYHLGRRLAVLCGST